MARRTLRSRFAALPAPLRRRRVWAIGFLLFLALIGFFVIRPFWKLTSQFEDLTFRQPSRIYARATRLYPGRPFPVAQLLQEIEDEGYRPYDGPPPVPAGRYIRTREGVALHQRGYPTPEGRRGGHFVEISYGGSRIRSLAVEGQPAEEVVLDPPLLASYYGPDLQERRPIPLDEVSEDLVQAVIAAEDDNFFRHSGVSFSGIARAVWVNARGHGVRQGGSTLTQQLVKNLYLTHERTLTRKSQEILLALLLELRYSKREILAAYLNEIYLGGAGKVSLLGVGAASRAYFGKDADQLDLAEAATLAGMIQAPAAYSPLSHPEKARQRRDWVLGRMAKLGSVPQDRIDQALETPLTTFPEPLSRPRASYFADAMAEEAKRRFQIEDLADGGYLLFSTLSWRDQQAAETAVDQGLEKVEAGYQKGYKGTGPLQAALVSVDPEAGGILAYVGGRSYRKSQFDRAGRALRQPGSAFKPIVYSAAFESHKFTPTTLLDDAPLTMRTSAGKPWSPKNDDGQFHGWVTVRRAMERSYNLATARLALQVGLPEIIQLAHDMGISVDMDPFPSVALGAIDATPVELATVYSTLASGGMRTETHGLIAVLDRYGKRVEGKALAAKRRVLSPQSAYMVTSLLQGVLVRGTAGGAARSIAGDLAGKTGTTNKRRDSWFAGYSPDRATVVWVGYDDNSSTRLSGARAALPIWTRFAG
ncbi:MAG TPA: PBP1A family penicillin-binding protein, partial [Thermoanaerobaculia bacterium]|nr:PBP1A family penicillin-binding protein [Thermoanaerobaculia bacterium]